MSKVAMHRQCSVEALSSQVSVTVLTLYLCQRCSSVVSLLDIRSICSVKGWAHMMAVANGGDRDVRTTDRTVQQH